MKLNVRSIIVVLAAFVMLVGCSDVNFNSSSGDVLSLDTVNAQNASLGEYNYSDNVAPSANPPGNLAVSQVPMFVAIGFDDNGYSGHPSSNNTGAMTWASSLFASRANPAGSGNTGTFDGQMATTTFYFTSWYINGWIYEDPIYVKKSWKTAMDAGHEIGNHTHSHPNGSSFSQTQWLNEINQCEDWLVKPYDPNEASGGNSSKGIGASTSQIFGFRTPYLAISDSLFGALKSKGFWYDVSIEEGHQPGQDGTNFLWPYTLDNGSPGNEWLVGVGSKPAISNHPGLWELPCYAVIVPPDNKCAEYGIPTGLRDKMKAKVNWFDTASGKISGLDYNLWFEFGMTKAEFIATMKYTFDLRLQGNRAPFLFCGHTDYYSSRYSSANANSTATERQQALEEFIDYTLTKQETRIVSGKQLVDWMRNPVALGPVGPTPTPTVDPTTPTPTVAGPTPTATPTSTAIPQTPTPTASGTCGYDVWDPNTAYSGGAKVWYNGSIWRAKWWTRGNTPGNSQEWAFFEECGGTTETPTPTATPTATAIPQTPTPTAGGQTPTPTATPTATIVPETPTPTSTPTTGPEPWAPYVNYAANDLVTYSGSVYKCLQPHQSLPGWEPPNVASLWQVQ